MQSQYWARHRPGRRGRAALLFPSMPDQHVSIYPPICARPDPPSPTPRRELRNPPTHRAGWAAGRRLAGPACRSAGRAGPRGAAPPEPWTCRAVQGPWAGLQVQGRGQLQLNCTAATTRGAAAADGGAQRTRQWGQRGPPWLHTLSPRSVRGARTSLMPVSRGWAALLCRQTPSPNSPLVAIPCGFSLMLAAAAAAWGWLAMDES